MLTLRKRGQTWHLRGTIRVGQEVRTLAETTGCRERQAAEAYKARRESEIRHELLHGPAGRQAGLTIEQALLDYVERPGLGLKEVWYCGQLGEVIGSSPVRDLPAAWRRFLSARCNGLKPSTVNRFRSVMVAALNHSGITVPKDLRAISNRNLRVRYLTEVEQERLIAAYDPHVQPIATFLCCTGARAQECLQLQWQHVDLERGTVWFGDTKSGRPRLVPVTARVLAMLKALHRERGEPELGHVFLNRYGKPYADNRKRANVGGNPLYKAHAAACRRAGIADFTPHDWRHHWASWAVMKGLPLPTIQRLGGWTTLQMLDRYVTVDVDHMADAVRKLA